MKPKIKFFRPTVGLALGGGAARGIAHLGVLKAFEEHHIKIDFLSGNSSGALIASLYAFSIPIMKIFEIMKELSWYHLKGLTLNRGGLFSNEFIGEIIRREIGNGTKIESSPVPLSINTSNIQTGELFIINKGDLAQAVMASSCAQGLFSPINFEGQLLTDGGIVENVPIESLRAQKSQIIFAINLNGQKQYPTPENMFEVLANAFDIAIDTTTKMQLKKAHVVLNFDLMKFGRAQAEEQAEELFDLGRSKAYLALKKMGPYKLSTFFKMYKTHYF